MPTKATKSDWNQVRKDLQEAAQKVREFTQGIALAPVSGNPLTQEQLRNDALSAYQQIEVAHMLLGNVIQTYDGQTPFAGQTL